MTIKSNSDRRSAAVELQEPMSPGQGGEVPMMMIKPCPATVPLLSLYKTR